MNKSTEFKLVIHARKAKKRIFVSRARHAYQAQIGLTLLSLPNNANKL